MLSMKLVYLYWTTKQLNETVPPTPAEEMKKIKNQNVQQNYDTIEMLEFNILRVLNNIKGEMEKKIKKQTIQFLPFPHKFASAPATIRRV